MINILLRNNTYQAIGSISNIVLNKKNKKILNKKKNSLPELMTRNLILGERLKNKINVSSFMNNAENKNQKYLKSFVISSSKRVKDLKTGLDLKNVIKKGINSLSPICDDINNDIIIKNGDYLIKQKKLINEKTEEETHNKINELIKGIKHIIKPVTIIKKPAIHKIAKSVSEEVLHKTKAIIKYEIFNDQKKIRNKIDYYIDKLNTMAETKPKEFHKIANHIYLKSNIKMINYIKPKVTIIKDSESTENIIAIRKHLAQSITNNDERKKKKEEKKNESEHSEEKSKISKNNYINNIPHKQTRKTNPFINNYSKDTLNIVKKLASQNKSLETKTRINLKKINSLVDIKLPYFVNYSRTIKYCKNKQRKKYECMSSDNFYVDDSNYYKKMMEFGFDKDNAVEKIKLIKEEINNLTDEKIYNGCKKIIKMRKFNSESTNY